jgi:hypothetical protein
VSEPTQTWRQRQGHVLVKLREGRGLKRADVVRLSGLTYWQIEGVETGKRELPAVWIPPLAEAIGISSDVVVDALGLVTGGPTPEETAELRATLEAAELPEDRIRELLSETRRLSQQPVRLAAIRAAISLWREVHPE